MANLLEVLKLDATILPQFFIFLIAYITLTQLVFKPYLKAFDQRRDATVGGKEIADQLLLETQGIQSNYETKARAINSQIKGIFDEAKKEASKKQEELIRRTREETETVVNKSRQEIQAALQKSREELKKSVPELSQTISNKMLGKEVN